MLNIARSLFKLANTRALATVPSTTSAVQRKQPAEIQCENHFVQERKPGLKT